MINFNRIAGYHKEKDELLSIRNLLLNVEKFKRSGIRMPRGVLLYGAPGVGKTVMARAIAGDDIALVELRSADCTRVDSEDYVLKAFEDARKKAPCILLIDELDKIAEGSDQYYMESNDRIMKVLLQELDGQKDNSGVIVVATCNRCDYINPALLRSGRFDRIIEIATPSLEDRIAIIKYYLSKITLEARLDAEYFGKVTSGYSGAQLECVINEAGVMAMQNGHDYIDMKVILLAMNRIAFRALEGRIQDRGEQWNTAVHEAGHAVAALMLAPETLFTATIIPQGNARGHVRFISKETANECIEFIENKAIIALTGSAAEEVILGKRYLSSMDDFSKARRNISLLLWGIGAYGIEFAGYSSSHHIEHPVSNIIMEKGEAICTDKLKEFYGVAMKIVSENRELVELVAHSLVEKSTLSKDDIISIYNMTKERKGA